MKADQAPPSEQTSMASGPTLIGLEPRGVAAKGSAPSEPAPLSNDGDAIASSKAAGGGEPDGEGAEVKVADPGKVHPGIAEDPPGNNPPAPTDHVMPPEATQRGTGSVDPGSIPGAGP
eukprot:jgi/Mesvir1/29249/Mv02413-RA.1